ncbi:hypothetical protein Tco_1091080 [Tanacetum coccineum]|uniref:Uncharacterized protein n=1 Tax=Tanacetum coccineum TaxID=301880 RepID=A0ABQ5I7X7_9ASTR
MESRLMVYVVDGVLVRGVDMILEMDFVCFAIQETEIHSLMIQIRILSIILKIFPTTLHNPSTRRILHAQLEDIQELHHKLLKDLKITSEELAEYINYPSWNCPTFYDDDDEYTIQYREYLENSSNAIAPDSPTKEPDNSLSMGDEHLSTIPETKSNKVIKSSVENLVPIPSESGGISDDTCDVPFCDNSPLLDVLNDHFEIFSYFNDDYTSSDEDFYEDIDYIEASPTDSELVSLEEIESLKDNPTPDCILKSPSLFSIPVKDSDSFFEKSDTSLSCSDNSLPEFETFSDHREETSSGRTTTHSDNSLPEYDSFLFEIEPDQVELTSDVMEDILGEPHVHVRNELPTHPTLMLVQTSFLLMIPSYPILKFLFLPELETRFLIRGYSLKSNPIDFYLGILFLSHLSDCPDFKDSRARGFVHRLLDLQSLACLYLGIRYPRSN